MYGARARIGYTSPPATTEVFPYEFYRVVPRGVTLVLTTLAIMEMNSAEVDASYQISLRAARNMAQVGVDLVVLGGVPINVSRGFDKVDELIRDTAAAIGVPVTTSVTAQVEALRATGARRIAIGHPFGPADDRLFLDFARYFGFEPLATERAERPATELGRIPLATAIELARALKAAAPGADTIWLPCPHWASTEAVDALEAELGLTVITANQAIVWHALRSCGVDDRLPAFGRLLRDH